MHNRYLDPLEVKDINDYTPREQTVLYVTYVRLDLYNQGNLCGPKAIQQEMKRLEISHIPSTATICRILRDQFLTHQRTGYYPGDYSSKPFD
jgi:hypothetical protein